MFGRPNFRKLMALDSTVSCCPKLLIFIVEIFEDKNIIINGYASKNTNFQWKRFDGTDLEYTNWGYGHPGMYSSVSIFAYYNGKVTRGHQESKMGCNTSDTGPTSSADDDVYSIELGAVRHNSYAYAICVRDMPIDE